MLGTYVLILVVWAGSSGAVTSAEYTSKSACEEAAKAADTSIAKGLTVIRYSCSPKGD